MKRISRWLPLIVAVSAVLVYAKSLPYPFFFDDEIIISQNANIMQLWTPLSWSLRSITDLTFKLNYAISGLNVVAFRGTNLLIHVAAGLALYGATRHTLLLPCLRDKFGKASSWLAFFVSLGWVLHPLQTASVTYICQRAESLMGLFYLLSLYCFLRYVGSERGRLWADLSIIACGVGMGTKEVMFTAPIMILICDYVLVAGSMREIVQRRCMYYIALFATWGIFAALYVHSMAGILANAGMVTSDVSALSYLGTQCGVLIQYLRLAFYPRGLCLDYAWPTVDSLAGVIVPGIPVLLIFVLTAWAIWRKKPAGIAGAWFFLILAPTSSVLPLLDNAFEHRMYLPLAGVIVLSMVCAFRWLGRRARRLSVLSLGLAVAICVVLALLTFARNGQYATEEGIWRDVVSKRPQNLRARNNLAVALVQSGRDDEATEQWAYVLKITESLVEGVALPRAIPDNSREWNYFKAHANMGQMLFSRGCPEESVYHYVRALGVWPYSDHVFRKLEKALRSSGIEDKHVRAEAAKRVNAERAKLLQAGIGTPNPGSRQ